MGGNWESIGSGIEGDVIKGVRGAHWIQAKPVQEDAFRDRIVAGFLPHFLSKFFR